jgi:hypothetical protein
MTRKKTRWWKCTRSPYRPWKVRSWRRIYKVLFLGIILPSSYFYGIILPILEEVFFFLLKKSKLAVNLGSSRSCSNQTCWHTRLETLSWLWCLVYMLISTIKEVCMMAFFGWHHLILHIYPYIVVYWGKENKSLENWSNRMETGEYGWVILLLLIRGSNEGSTLILIRYVKKRDKSSKFSQ